jgi:hypothetical protein
MHEYLKWTFTITLVAMLVASLAMWWLVDDHAANPGLPRRFLTQDGYC